METKLDRGLWVYDIETLKSCFTYSAINVDTEEKVKFVIHKERNDIEGFKAHLRRKCKGMIGFNNIGFDYPVIHYILTMPGIYGKKGRLIIIDNIYNKAQDIIKWQNHNVGFNPNVIKDKDIIIPQLDLFKLWHFNNKARMTSLKSLEIAMGFPNVMDMPIEHDYENITLRQVDEILEYNMNDVLATFAFYKLSIDKINLRKGLFSKYGLKCINYPDSKIGEELVLKLYCEATDTNPWDIKKLRSERPVIALKDCIFDYIMFTTNEFKELLITLKNKVVTEIKGAIEESVVYKGFKYDYGLGGIHGCIKPGIYEADNDYLIIDADVASLYPSIAIVNSLYPEHLGEEFCEVYENGIVKPRLAAKKAGEMIMADGFKLSANSVYGKSNDDHSFLKDPIYTLKTTLNGQLLLSMLFEELNSKINLTMLQVNTDGVTIKIHKNDVALYYAICAKWEVYSRLTLEYVEYSKMIIRDVNNYIAITTKGKIKQKGAFKVNSELIKDGEYHKDFSFNIIRIALLEFFINDIPVDITIKNNVDIYNFCGRQKFKGDDWGETHELDYNHCGLRYTKIEKQQKNVRYYISKPGASFIKKYAKGSDEIINKGYQVTIFNNYFELNDFKDYNIDYSFYIKEANKEINNIIDKQLTLF